MYLPNLTLTLTPTLTPTPNPNPNPNPNPTPTQVRTMYRWMNTGYYSVLCSSDARGQVHVDEEALEGRIDRMLGMLQLKGLLFICIAVLSQVVWLVGLTSYSSRMIDLMPN